MVDASKLSALAELQQRQNFYEILGVTERESAQGIKDAFHRLALAYHPDRFLGCDERVVVLATRVFKRVVEAYRILARDETRKNYGEMLRRGSIRYDLRVLHAPKPAPKVVTLEMLARSMEGKKFARNADRMLSAGQLDGARLALTNALQVEPDNDALRERMQWIYEAMALEPL